MSWADFSVRAGNALFRVFDVETQEDRDALLSLSVEELRDKLVVLAHKSGKSVRWLLLKQRGCGRKTVNEIFKAIGGEPMPPYAPEKSTVIRLKLVGDDAFGFAKWWSTVDARLLLHDALQFFAAYGPIVGKTGPIRNKADASERACEIRNRINMAELFKRAEIVIETNAFDAKGEGR